MRVMITGRTGFVGYHSPWCQRLLAEVVPQAGSAEKVVSLYGDVIPEYVVGYILGADTFALVL